MNLPGNLTGILSVLSVALSILGLVISPVSAAVGMTGSDIGVSVSNSGHYFPVNNTQQTARLQTEITKLGQQGIDVSVPQADITGGNIKGGFQWLAAYHEAHPASLVNRTRSLVGNSTRITARLQTEITKLGQQGVDVSQPQTDITSGNPKAAFQWLMAYHKAHPAPKMTWSESGNSTRQKGAVFGLHPMTGNRTQHHPWATGNKTVGG